MIPDVVALSAEIDDFETRPDGSVIVTTKLSDPGFHDAFLHWHASYGDINARAAAAALLGWR